MADPAVTAAFVPRVATIDIVILFAYMLGVLVIGVYCGRRMTTASDFFLAGKTLPFWAVGMSIVVTDIGAMDMVSGAGAAYKYGLAQANFDWLGSIPAMVIVAFLFIPFYWRSGVRTLPEFLGRRYGPTVRGLQAVIWLGFMISMLAIMLWASAVFLGTVMGWPTLVSIWITVLIVGIYTVLGGLAAVVMTDVIQMVVMFVGTAALLVLCFWRIGGWDRLVATVQQRGPEFHEHFQLLLPHNTTSPYPWTGIVMGLGLVLSTAYFSGNQAIVQRTLGARSEWDAKASLLFGAFLKLFIPILIMIPGLAALALFPHLPDPDNAMPTMVRDLLPPGLTGLIFAAFFAALMSSVDSYLNSSVTVVISDFYQPLHRVLRKTEAPDHQCLRLGQGLTALLIVIAGISAPIVSRFETLYLAIQTLFSVFQGPTLAILLLGIVWRRTNSPGATAGLILGVLFSISLNLVGDQLFPSANPFLFVSFASFAFALIMTMLVSLLTPPPPNSRTQGLTLRETVLPPAHLA